MDKIVEFDHTKKQIPAEIFKQMINLKKLTISQDQIQKQKLEDELGSIEELVLVHYNPHVNFVTDIRSLKILTISLPYNIIHDQKESLGRYFRLLGCCRCLETLSLTVEGITRNICNPSDLPSLPADIFPTFLVNLILRTMAKSCCAVKINLAHCTRLKKIIVGEENKECGLAVIFPQNTIHICIYGASLYNNLSELKQLKELYIFWGQPSLSQPVSTINLSNLTKLTVSPWRGLAKVEGGFEKLVQLEELVLNQVSLDVIPSSIFKLSKLSKLTITNCCAKQIEDTQTTQISSSKLKYVNLSDNNLIVLPDFVYNLPLLETLVANNNMLTKIFNGITSNRQLREVSFSNNIIVEICDAFKFLINVKILNLNINYMTAIPNINQLSSLETLAIENTPIDSISTPLTIPIKCLTHDSHKIKGKIIKNYDKTTYELLPSGIFEFVTVLLMSEPTDRKP